MSRIGKLPINIPSGVDVSINGTLVTVKGKLGEMSQEIDSSITISIDNGVMTFVRESEAPSHRSKHGLYRALIQNMITGVDQQFSKTLIAEGVGYRFQLEKTKLIVNVGYTNPIQFIIPEELIIKLESNTKIQLLGIDNEKVGFFAAKIRDMRPPEPYKGKGILYEGEKIVRKAGKTGK